ncbi:MAG: Na+/H+ antiporter NhaA, partial [Candidatus Binatia bacterium]
MTSESNERSATRVRAWVIHPLQEFIRHESSGGVVLLAATVIALLWANGPLGTSYDALWHADLRLGLGRLAITEPLEAWVNDGLMTIFFFVVGLEIKRELL